MRMSSHAWKLPAASLLATAALLGACGRPEQTPACAAYVACVRARDVARDSAPTDLVRFEPAGKCWRNGPTAESCDSACTRGVELLHRLHPALPECAP